ncbi:MAG: T9SS type A sorting domain-containing protein [Bacteroidetes bacterium]|nr:T9SS type A sorting domain-containing protein [Bacteroidota bacterium]
MRSTLIFVFLLFCAPSLFAQRELVTDRSALFSGSGNCGLCHTASGDANTTAEGEDVSPATGWRSSMMASAARDPYWQATVVAESMENPQLADIIEDKCTNCHTPMGHEEAHRAGATAYTLSDARQDPLAMDGVSCTLCHQVVPDNFGETESFSGGYRIAEARVTFGPYENPLIQPMKNLSGYEPVHAVHMAQSEHCATCHTLFTPYLDKQGNIAGEFPEQTPYLEWRASVYPARQQSCQSCHIPALDEAMRISSIPPMAGDRSPIYQHHFNGGNSFMLNVIKTHAVELGATAYDEHFDASIERSKAQLRASVALSSDGATVQDGELRFSVEVQNLTGHKFPTGFPSRRAWLSVIVRDSERRSVFVSGVWDEQGEIVGLDTDYEPHRNIVRVWDEIPVWESVMGDVDGDVTAKLLHAAQYLKDNRIPPQGFDIHAMANDTIGVVGVEEDDDFNDFDGNEYTGRDVVHYRLPLDPEWSPPFQVSISMCYQSIKPKFINKLKNYDAVETRRMVSYYEAVAQKDHVELVDGLFLESKDVNAIGSMQSPVVESLELYPHPLTTEAGVVHVRYALHRPMHQGTLVITDLMGRELRRLPLQESSQGMRTRTVDISSLDAGMYFIVLHVENQRMAAPMCILR